MSDAVRWSSPGAPQRRTEQPPRQSGTDLADILERVLDKGIVIAGDIQVNLLDIELLTIKLRLVVASVDRAKEMGIDWWERDPTLSSGHQELTDENARLRARVEELEAGRNGNGHRPAVEAADDELDAPEGEIEDEFQDEFQDEDEFQDDDEDVEPADEIGRAHV